MDARYFENLNDSIFDDLIYQWMEKRVEEDNDEKDKKKHIKSKKERVKQ